MAFPLQDDNTKEVLQEDGMGQNTLYVHITNISYGSTRCVRAVRYVTQPTLCCVCYSLQRTAALIKCRMKCVKQNQTESIKKSKGSQEESTVLSDRDSYLVRVLQQPRGDGVQGLVD
jgi:hypothetical protein